MDIPEKGGCRDKGWGGQRMTPARDPRGIVWVLGRGWKKGRRSLVGKRGGGWGMREGDGVISVSGFFFRGAPKINNGVFFKKKKKKDFPHIRAARDFLYPLFFPQTFRGGASKSACQASHTQFWPPKKQPSCGPASVVGGEGFQDKGGWGFGDLWGMHAHVSFLWCGSRYMCERVGG